MIVPVEEKLRALLGKLIYGADVPNLETVVLTLLNKNGMTLGTAESCTGGLIAKRMTDVPGSSAVFKGGVVSYCNEIKANVLGVPQVLLDEFGAVSEPVAKAMAEGARKVLDCDLAVAATGVAGPGSDDQGNPAGLVYVALAAPNGTYVRELRLSGASRQRVRTTAAHHAFDMVRRFLGDFREI